MYKTVDPKEAEINQYADNIVRQLRHSQIMTVTDQLDIIVKVYELWVEDVQAQREKAQHIIEEQEQMIKDIEETLLRGKHHKIQSLVL